MCLLNKKYFLLDINVYLLNLIKIYHIVYFQDLLKIQVPLLKNYCIYYRELLFSQNCQIAIFKY